MEDVKSNTRRRRFKTKSGTRPGSNGSVTYSSPSQRRDSMDTQALIGHSLKLQDWLNAKSVEIIQKKSNLEMKETNRLVSPLLLAEENFVKDIERFLDHQKIINRRRKEMLHKRWHQRVRDPISREIKFQTDKNVFDDLLNRKNVLYKEYLRHRNKLGHVSLDTVYDDEYYALGLLPMRPSPPIARVPRLDDPLLHQERKRAEEDRAMFACETGMRIDSDKEIHSIHLPFIRRAPISRNEVNYPCWMKMPITGNIDSDTHKISMKKRQGATHNNNQFTFHNYGEPMEHWLVQKELYIPKLRTVSAVPDHRQGNPNILAHQPFTPRECGTSPLEATTSPTGHQGRGMPSPESAPECGATTIQ